MTIERRIEELRVDTNLHVGVEDNVRGIVRIEGDDAGVQGLILVRNGATQDGVTDAWAIGGNSGQPDLQISQTPGSATSFFMTLLQNGGLQLKNQTADPADPNNGQFVIWMSEGTGSGDDGDILMKITDSGGTTKTVTLFDFNLGIIPD